MLISGNGQSFSNSRNNTRMNILNIPIKHLDIQNINNINNNPYMKPNNLKNHSLYPSYYATPRKEYNQVLINPVIKKHNHQPKKKIEKNDLDESIDQISQILNNNKKDLNYSGLIGKIPGINEESNFVYDQMLYNKSRINKAKILSHKIKVLKLPMMDISNVSTKEKVTNSDRSKGCISDRIKGDGHSEGNNRKNSNMEDKVDIICCFFNGK